MNNVVVICNEEHDITPGVCALCERDELRKVLKLAQAALNTAPRFKVPGQPADTNDSYKIAALVSSTLRGFYEQSSQPPQ